MDVSSALLLVVALVGHSLFWTGLLNRAHSLAWPRWIVESSTVVCAAGVVGGLVLLAATLPLSFAPRWLQVVPHQLAMGYQGLAIVASVIGLAHALWVRTHPERKHAVSRVVVRPLPVPASLPELLHRGLPRWLGCMPGNQAVAPVVVEKQLAVPNLAAPFRGLRLAHLSDLHMSGRLHRCYFDALVDATNELEPDLVFLTGDIVEHNACLEWIDSTLARLQARHGCYFVLGNHDLRSDHRETRRRLGAAGFIDAASRWQSISLPHGPCWLVGNERPWFGTVPPPPPAEAQQARVLRLGITHTPDLFAWGQRQQLHLLLAGHNHGGQVRLPGLGALLAPSRYGTRYAQGDFEYQGTVMHVSRGSGSLAPLRWNCPPEVTLLEL